MNPEQLRARKDRAAAARAAAGRPDPRSGSGSAPADPDRPELALYRSPRWKITKRSVIARDCGICIVCKHVGDWGKMSADHIESRAEAPDIDFFDHRNLGAVHSWPAPCVQCSDLCGTEVFCNQIKSARSLKAARRRILDLTGRDPMGPHVEPESKPEGRDL